MDFEDNIDINIDISDMDEDNYIADNRVVTAYIRIVQNSFECYDENEFKRRFRFNEDSVLYGILPKVIEGLAKINNRGLPISPELQLLACLRYYATASFQQLLGDSMQISQPTVYRIVFRVRCLLAGLISEFIKMARDFEPRIENRRLFADLGKGNGEIGLPGIDGAIDCTHVRLVNTRFHITEIFQNRKGYFTLNVQAVVGPRTEFLGIVPEWPGSAHDSRIFQNSAIRMRYVEQRFDGILVGDQGYACLPFLMTPLANPQTDEELMYNDIQIRTSLIVERTFGIWKHRFPCLSRGVSTKLVCSTAVVVACAVLHNMPLIFKDVLPDCEDLFVDDEEVPLPAPHNPRNLNRFAVREALSVRLFN